MNTFKIFLNAYKPSLYMALMPMGLFIILTVVQAIVPPQPNGMNNVTFLFSFFIFALLPNVFYKSYEKKILYLLPTSRRTKFFMPLGIAFLTIIVAWFLTIPIEAMVHLFTLNNESEQQIVVGGFLKYGFIHNSTVFIPLVINCAFVFLHTLVRSKILIMSLTTAICFGMVFYIPNVGEFFMSSPALSTNAIIGCLASSVIFIAASYQLFKRWQPANDGIFRI